MKRSLIETVLAANALGRPTVLATDLKSGLQAVVQGTDVEGDLPLDAALKARIADASANDRSGVVETADGPVFLQVFNPPLRLLIVGAVHIAQVLAPMAALAGYAVTVIDPRSAFATDERFPHAALSDDWPDEAMEKLQPDPRTAVVTLTHDPKLDDPALVQSLRSQAFYIGCLGSRKTHAARCERLKQAGFGDSDLARLHGPIGLDIGALSPAEIAISVLAQITSVLHGGPKVKAAA